MKLAFIEKQPEAGIFILIGLLCCLINDCLTGNGNGNGIWRIWIV